MNYTAFFPLQAFKAELTEKLKIVEQIRSTFNQVHGDGVTSSAHQTTQVLHKTKLDAIDETGAAQQLRNIPGNNTLHTTLFLKLINLVCKTNYI